MSDQTDKSKPRTSGKDVLPEEAKDTKKTQSEEGFGWSIEAEGSVSDPASPQAEPGGGSQDRDPHPVPGPTSILDHGQQETSAPPQGPLSPPDQEAPFASHGLAGATETFPAPVADIPANAAPHPDVDTLSSAGHLGATERMPTGTHTPPPSAAGSAPSPDSGNKTQPQSGVTPTAGGGHTPPTSTGTTPPPGGTQTPPTSTGGTPPPGGTQTPPTSTGGTPPPGGTQTPPTSTGTTPTPGGGHTPSTTTAARISGLDTDTAREDHHVVGGKLSAGGLLTVSDPDAGEDKFQAVAGAPGSAGYGSFTVAENGRWTYSADNSQAVIQALRPGNSLVDRVTVHSADGTAHELRVVITGTNDTPVLSAASASATEDGSAVTGQMSATDVDAGDTKTFSIAQPVDGFSMNADGSWSFDPSHAAYQHLAADQTQQVTIPVTVTDSAGVTDTENLVITVTGTNDAPVVSGPVDLGSGTEDKSVPISAAQLLAHATDIDTGDQLSVSGLTVSHGTITGDAAHGFTFTPDPNYNGPVTLSYQVTDGHGGSAPQTASLTLGATPDAAVITGTDTGSATEDKVSSSNRLVVSGSLNVSDPDGPPQEHFQYSSFGEHAVSDPFGGSLHIDRAGTWQYEVDNTNPAVQSLAAGQEGHAVYEVRSYDGTAHQIRITIHGTNDAPVLSAATASATEDGQSVKGQMSATDIDTGDTKAFSIAQTVDGFTMHADGSWSFDPSHAAYQHLAAGQTQQVTIPVTVTDSSGAADTENLVITVRGTGDAAVIGGVDTGNVTENMGGQDKSPDYAQPGMTKLWHHTIQATGTLTITDPDTGEASFDTHGIGWTYHGQYGDLMLRENGEWFYNADVGSIRSVGGLATTRGTTIDRLGEGQSLTDTITVYSKDGTAHDIVITIHGSNDRPYCSSEVQLAGGTEDVAQTLTLKQLLANTVDVDANDAGKLAIAGLKVDHGSVRDNQDGTFTFTPEKDYNGQVHFTYDVKDAHGGLTHTGAITTLAAAEDAAVITGTDTGSVTEDQVSSHGSIRLVVNGYLNISDPDGHAWEHFQFSQFGEHAVSDPFGGNLHIDRAGIWQYEVDNTHPAVQALAAGQEGHAVYEVHSADGTAHRIQITIHGTNDAPILSAATASATEDGSAVTGQMTATDIDTGDTKAFSIGQPVDGFSMNPDGSWSFDPSHAAYQHLAAGQTQQVTIPVTVTDSAGAADTETLVITVTGTNDAPVVFGATTGSVTEDRVATTGQLQTLWTNIDVQDPDGAGESHIVGIEVGGVLHQIPANFAATVHGTYGYFQTTHSTDGHDKWMYAANNSNPAIQGLKTGEHLDETAVLVTSDGTRIPLTVTINGHEDGVVIDTPSSLVQAIGDVVEDTRVQVTGFLQAHDADTHDTVTFTPQTTTNAYGTFTVDAAGQWSFTLDNAAAQHLSAGLHTAMGFDIEAVSSDGSRVTQHVQVNVRGSNDAPVLTAASASATEDGQFVTGQMSATDVDTGDTKAFSVGQPVDGFSMNADGSWSFDPAHAAYQHLAAGQTLQVTIPVTVTDSAGATDTQNLVITVTGTDDATVFGGVQTGDAHEDGNDVHVVGHHYLHDATDWQQITVTDPDGPVSQLTVEHGGQSVTWDMHSDLDIATPYGKFQLVHADGSGMLAKGYYWNYIGDNNNPAVQALKAGETLPPEQLTLVSPDGVRFPLTVTVHGAEDGIRIDTRGTLDHVSEQGPTTPVGVSGQLQAHDPDAHDSVTWQPTPTGGVAGRMGTFTVDASGHWEYHVDPAKAATLGENMQMFEHFTITALSTDGSQASQRISVEVRGTDQAPELSAFATSATEDGRSIRGHMSATDVDVADQVHFTAPSIAGFTLNGDGSWSFDPTDAAYQHLADGAKQQLTIPVTVTDKAGLSDTQNLVITVTGTNDAAHITGTDSATVVEDRNLSGGNLTAAGTLAVTDADTGQDSFTPLSGQQGTGGYGSFSIDAQGHWTYTADNSQQVIQQLGHGQSLTDTCVVTSSDGTQHTLTVTIDGTDEAPVVKPSMTAVHGMGTQHLAGTLASGGLGGWAIDNGHGGAVQSLQGQFGTLTINPQTGHFEYHYQQNSGVIKHGGSSAASGQHVDTFHITQQGTAAGDVDVQVQVSVQSVHGASGHHVDHTVLQGITFTPAPTVQHDAPHDVDTVVVTLDLSDAAPMSDPSSAAQGVVSASLDLDHTGTGPDGDDTGTASPPSPDAPAEPESDRLAAYFEAIGQGHDAAASPTAPAAHLSSYLDAAGAAPDMAAPVADLPDPSTLDIDGMSADVEDHAPEAAEPQQSHDVPQDIPEPVLPDPNDDTSQYG
ncbi:VCBS domain-containing protein [Roseibium sediminicola]|uniref:VCBS domain-containing protein n=1 Tax=Roseibium sediminicola TaxID=2933272 RepID=A0ABT0GXC7_9HYPH|nr:VCBS domain-containing protein [Roseibium sp. CAU 1639]MCK7613707.1 VCBS domain-containing protein [Roseibium sp. CAU 1639]